MDPEDEHEHMGIYEISAMGAGIAYGGGVEIETMLRKGTVVFCEAGGMTVDFEKVIGVPAARVQKFTVAYCTQ